MRSNGSTKVTRSAFDIFHPLVALVAFILIIANAMSAFHPLYLSISLIISLVYSSYLFGIKDTFRSLLWQLPLVLIIALINPFFSASGSSTLFYIGLRAIYAESLIYGLCMGGLLILSLTWFRCAFAILDMDKITALFSRFLPSVGLMLSMAMRLVPEFLKRGQTINETLSACTSARIDNSKKKGLATNFRNMTVLMSWSMEDSISAADSMKISGWGASQRRTTYQIYRFRKRDALLLAIILIIGIISSACTIANLSSFKFYPTITSLTIDATIVPFILMLTIPLILETAVFVSLE